MKFSERDRVRLVGGTGLGTVTNQWSVTKGEPTRFGVQWDHGTFAFVEDHHLMLADPVAIPGMTEADRAALAGAHRRALEAVAEAEAYDFGDPCPVTVINWQARAEAAEAKIAAVRQALSGRGGLTAYSILAALDADQ